MTPDVAHLQPCDDRAPRCRYCGRDALFVSGATLFPSRPECRHRTYARCFPCKAHVVCHDGTRIPIGPLANEELRNARSQIHEKLGELWRGRPSMRGRVYNELARDLRLPGRRLTVSTLELETCIRALEILSTRPRSAGRRRGKGSASAAEVGR